MALRLFKVFLGVVGGGLVGYAVAVPTAYFAAVLGARAEFFPLGVIFFSPILLATVLGGLIVWRRTGDRGAAQPEA